MDKGKLKSFATEARGWLIDHIGARIRFILTHETPELAAKAGLKEKLRVAWENTPDKDAFIERHAYTFFNRLIALRYMDARGYNFVPVVTPRAAGGDPAILADARNGLFPEGLPVDRARVEALLSGNIPSANKFNEAYKLLFIAACAGFNKTMPFMFEPLNSYAEILLPDDLLSENSIIAFVNSNLGTEECANVEVIGWLYQFYIQEKKDKVFADKKNSAKRKKDEIAAVTQLFTPAWIVKYMVQNGLGKLWMLKNPGSPLKNEMPYYLPTELTNEDVPEINSPEEIKVLDPCAGSGHTLVYAFDLLMKIYEESGYYKKDIPGLILKHNLTGLELDNRAAALASFALIMKAREYDRGIINSGITPKVYSLDDDRMLHPWDIEGAKLTKDESAKAEFLAAFFKDADILGSLLNPEFSAGGARAEIFHDDAKKDELEQRADTEITGSITLKEKLDYSETMYKALASKYHFVVTNPPYLPGNSNPVLKSYLEKHYKDSKSDLFAAFIERCVAFTDEKCFTGMITQHAWMFLSSFEELRKKLIKKYFIDSMAHLGARAFEEIGGEVVQVTAFEINHAKHDTLNGTFVRLVEVKDAKEKEKIFISGILRSTASSTTYTQMPGYIIAYWMRESTLKLFDNSRLSDFGSQKTRIVTGKNDEFLRFWFEVSNLKLFKGKKWIPYSKGGVAIRYYGNYELVINYENDGEKIKEFPGFQGASDAYYYLPGLTWSELSSNNIAFRLLPEGFICDKIGPQLLLNDFRDTHKYLLGCLNSKVIKHFLSFISPTLSFNWSALSKLPIIVNKIHKTKIETMAHVNLSISKEEYNSHETSWDFQASPLLSASDSPLLAERYETYKQYWSEKFFELHQNEEELNRIFIDIYGLQDELTPDVELKDVTILQQEKIITEEGGLDFNTAEVVKQFISYAVGCMFGRYSLDKPGLILANQGETLKDYLERVPEPRFLPDEDNIIPVLDEEFFPDDIVFRFNRFLEAALGKEEFEANRKFIESALGMPLRRYFNTKFYEDHLRRYKKRPIYWMVSSPGGSFKALIYMHRYNSQTMSKLFNDYLKEYRSKLTTRLNDLRDGITFGANPVREEARLNRAIKDTEDLILAITPLAMTPVEIDLDDGVKVNLARFKGVVVQI